MADRTPEAACKTSRSRSNALGNVSHLNSHSHSSSGVSGAVEEKTFQILSSESISYS